MESTKHGLQRSGVGNRGRVRKHSHCKPGSLLSRDYGVGLLVKICFGPVKKIQAKQLVVFNIISAVLCELRDSETYSRIENAV